MAILIDGDRKAIWAEWMEEISNRRESASLLKADIRAAIDAIDDWIEANMSSFNSGIPLPARTVLTARQKVELLLYVIRRKWEVS